MTQGNGKEVPLVIKIPLYKSLLLEGCRVSPSKMPHYIRVMQEAIVFVWKPIKQGRKRKISKLEGLRGWEGKKRIPSFHPSFYTLLRAHCVWLEKKTTSGLLATRGTSG